MTALTKDDFSVHAGYVTYAPRYPEPSHFMARFKYGASTSARPFVTFLCRNFTKEELLAAVAKGESMYTLAEGRGFLLSHIKKWLKRDGYPVTRAGYAAWFAEECRKSRERDDAERAAELANGPVLGTVEQQYPNKMWVVNYGHVSRRHYLLPEHVAGDIKVGARVALTAWERTEKGAWWKAEVRA